MEAHTNAKNVEGPAGGLETGPHPGKLCPVVTRALLYIEILAGLVVPLPMPTKEKALALRSYVRWTDYLDCWGPMNDHWWKSLVWPVTRGRGSGCLQNRSRS